MSVLPVASMPSAMRPTPRETLVTPSGGVARTVPAYSARLATPTSRALHALTHFSFMALTVLSERDCLDHAQRVELGLSCCQRRVPARGGVEDEEAHLVAGNVNRTR